MKKLGGENQRLSKVHTVCEEQHQLGLAVEGGIPHMTIELRTPSLLSVHGSH